MLTEKQIDALFTFIESEGVVEYDLQIELVDHLASAIEDKLDVDQSLTPYAALQEVYAGFGREGFTNLVNEKRDAVKKQNIDIYSRILTQYFKSPRILLLLIVFFSFYSTTKSLSPERRGWTFGLVAIVFFVFQFIALHYTWKNCKKKLMLVQNYSAYYFLLSLVVLLVGLLRKAPAIPGNFSFAVLITLISTALLATLQFNKQLKEKAQILYPKAFINS